MERLLDPHFGLMFWTIVNFFLLVIILGKFVWKPMLASIDNREKKISNDIESAGKSREEADKIKKEAQESMEKITQKSNQLLKEAKEHGEKERERIIEAARQESHRIINSARSEIKAETQQALKQIQSSVADIVIAASEKLIEKNVDSKENREFSEKLIKQLDKNKN